MQFTIFNTKKKRVKFVFIHNSHIHFFNNDNIKFINGIDMQIKLYYNTCIFALITIVDPLFIYTYIFFFVDELASQN